MEKSSQDKSLVRSSAAEYLTYIASAGDDKDSIEMRYEDENIWLTQKMLAALYGVSIATINQHIKKIFADRELEAKATIKNFLIVQKEGARLVSRNIEHYNLQLIIAVVSIEGVVAGIAVQIIVASTAIDLVNPIMASNHIIASQAVYYVVQ